MPSKVMLKWGKAFLTKSANLNKIGDWHESVDLISNTSEQNRFQARGGNLLVKGSFEFSRQKSKLKIFLAVISLCPESRGLLCSEFHTIDNACNSQFAINVGKYVKRKQNQVFSNLFVLFIIAGSQQSSPWKNGTYNHNNIDSCCYDEYRD